MTNTYVPAYIGETFAKRGIHGLLYAVHTDMASDGSFADVYIAVDYDRLYVLTGRETIERKRKKTGPTRIVSDFTETDFATIPYEELAEPKTERLLSVGRLTAKTSGEKGILRVVAQFSLGHMGAVDRLLKVVKNLTEEDKKGEEGEKAAPPLPPKRERDPYKDVKEVKALFCPKCDTRYPEPDRQICPKCMDRRSIALRLLKMFGLYKGKVAIIFGFMLFSTALLLLSPYISTRMFLDEVLQETGDFYRRVGVFVLFLLGVRAFQTGLNIVFLNVLARIVPWIVFDLKLRIFQAMQRLSVGFYTSKHTGAIMNRVGRDAGAVYWFFVDGIPFIITNVLTLVGVIAIMFWLNPLLAAISVSVVPLTMVLFKIIHRMFRRFWRWQWIYNSQMNEMVSDSVNGQRVIKAFAREDDEVRRFDSVGNKFANTQIAAINTRSVAFPFIFLIMFLGQVIVTAVGGLMVVRGDLSLGTLMTFIAYLGMLYGPLDFLSWVSDWWARCLDASQRVFEILDAEEDVKEPAEPTRLPEMHGAVTVTDCWFEYDPNTPILKGLSLDVPAGQTLGIVGKTGSGKTTLANLIARLYDVKSGNITIDGVDVKQLAFDQLRRNVGIVSQEIYLFIGSIADNIRYAKPEATVEEVIWAAKMASAHDFIVSVPDGYETRVGAGGQDLSGGERQRLSIARTIIQNPKILILDEATAAMDTETEGKIQAALNQLQSGRTTLAIAHRLSTLKDTDRLAVINDGTVAETGTHEELMRAKGEYHKLYMLQMEALKVISME